MNYHPWYTTTIEGSEHYQETTRGMAATKWLHLRRNLKTEDVTERKEPPPPPPTRLLLSTERSIMAKRL